MSCLTGRRRRSSAHASLSSRLNRVFASLTSMNARDKQRPKQLVDNTLWSMEITEVLMKWMSWLVCLDIP